MKTNNCHKELKQLRKRAGLTLRDLSELTGMPKSTLSNYESRVIPSVIKYRLIESVCLERIKTNYMEGIS